MLSITGEKGGARNVCFLFALFLIASIPTSKAGMNVLSVFSLIAVMSFPFVLKCQKDKHVAILFLIVYATFSIFALAFHGDIDDFFIFLQKNSFLLVIPALSVCCKNDEFLDRALYVFVFFCLVASIKSIFDALLLESGSAVRVTGFLDYSRHLNALLLGFCISIVCYFKIKKNRAFFASAIFLILISVFISGTRGAWIAFTASFLFFILKYEKRMVMRSMLFLSVVVLLLAIFKTDSLLYALDRAVSIFNLDTDISNMQRLSMWAGGLNYLKYCIEFSPVKFFLGSGMYSSSYEYYSYLDSLPAAISEQYKFGGDYLGGTDFHSAVLDLVIKSGFVYGVSLILSIVSVLYFSLKGAMRESNISAIVATYLVGVLFMSPFYSLYQDYSSFTIAFSVALFFSQYMRLDFKDES